MPNLFFDKPGLFMLYALSLDSPIPDFKFPQEKVQAYTNAAYKFEYLKIAE